MVVHGDFDDVGVDQTKIYTKQGAPVGFWRRNAGNSFHYDMTVDPADGREVVVGVSNLKAEGEVIKRRLQDGVLTRLTFAGSYASHVSTRNLDRPGWAYVTYERSPAPYRSEVVALKLDGTVVERYAQTRNRKNPDYWGEAHGSPSPDGQRVIWASSWGSRRPVQSYMGDVRALR